MFSEFEIKRYEAMCEEFCAEHGPPSSASSRMSWGYQVFNQSVVLLELRPDVFDPDKNRERPFAKATFVKKDKHWKVLCKGSNMKWKKYKACPFVETLEDFFEVVIEDAYHCFIE